MKPIAVVTLPLRVKITKKKWCYLNLNHYRNDHFQVLNKAKKLFKEEVTEQIKKVPVMDQCLFRYYLHLPDASKRDVANVGAVVDKYFSDAFVELGKLPDDNYEHLLGVSYEFGGIDRENPRVEVEIYKLG